MSGELNEHFIGITDALQLAPLTEHVCTAGSVSTNIYIMCSLEIKKLQHYEVLCCAESHLLDVFRYISTQNHNPNNFIQIHA